VLPDSDSAAGEQVTLSAAGSRDEDGTIVSYAWSVNGKKFASGNSPTLRVPDGTHGVTLTVTDDDGDTDIAQTVIKVGSIVPYASSCSAETPMNQTIRITLPVADANNEDLSYILVSQPHNGTVRIAGNAATYTPIRDFHGFDRFTFKANDGTQDSNIAMVSVQVVPPLPKQTESLHTGDGGHLTKSGS